MSIQVKILVHLPTHQAILPGATVENGESRPIFIGAAPGGAVKANFGGVDLVVPPGEINALWMTDDDFVALLVSDGAGEDVAEDVVAEVLAALVRRPYWQRSCHDD